MKDEYETSDVDNNIRNRNSWLRVFVIVVIVIVFVWKLIETPIQIDLTKFDFSDMLSLILALFAMALSVLFYLKATDTSNAFYDNTYRFTRDVSEILGRIEAGFGERLRHLDEGYSGLVNRLPSALPEQVQEEIVNEQKKLDEVEKQRNELLNELTKRAKLQDQEKTTFLKSLEEKDINLAQSRAEISLLRDQLGSIRKDMAKDGDLGVVDARTHDLIVHLVRMFVSDIGGNISAMRMDRKEIRNRFEKMILGLTESRQRDLRRAGLLDPNMVLNDIGFSFIWQELRQLIP